MAKKKKDLLNFAYRDTNNLIPYARNAKIHTDEQITKIAASIREFGFMSPIVLDKDDTILAGHGRVLAAKKLGMKEVPAVQAEHLSEAQRKAYILADNRTAEEHSGWDNELLKIELEELEELDFNIDDIMSFSFDDVDEQPTDDEKYTAKVEAPLYEPKEIAPPPVHELFNDSKAASLIESIERAEAPDEVKTFLKAAAQRHTRFRYDRIAEYYSHASKEVQELMEESALVIIDFNKAVEHGFAKLANNLRKELPDERP